MVRDSVIGRNAFIDTPFGKRLVTYADYTASGRGVEFVERYIQQILRHYANTHTEDDRCIFCRFQCIRGKDPGVRSSPQAAPARRPGLFRHRDHGQPGPGQPHRHLFVIRVDDSYLHPRFVTILLNDLFGIQSRAGCSCAGPYGHRILHIDGPKSLRFKDRLLHGFGGLKPGWIRINFHYLMTDVDCDFIMAAVCLVCSYGKYFLPLYEFDIHTGSWRHRTHRAARVAFGLAQALDGLIAIGHAGAAKRESAKGKGSSRMSRNARKALYDRYLEDAKALGEELKKSFDGDKLKTTEKELMPFVYV